MRSRLRAIVPWVGVVAALATAGCAKPTTVRPDADATGQLGAVRAGNPADVYVDLAAEYLRQKNPTAALQNAKKAVMVDPNYSSAHNVMAVVYQQLGERDLAERHFRRAIDLDPRDPYALNAYGSFLCASDRYEQADEMFRRSLQNPLYPTPWIAQANAGFCAEKAGQLGQAEAYLRAALRANPRFGPALLRMAAVSFEQGNVLSARAYLQRYVEVADHTAESLWLGIRTERLLGDRDQVASYSLLLRARFPDSEEVQLLNESRAP